MKKAVGDEKAGSHFLAITDPGSKMEQVAKADGFRHIFYGDRGLAGAIRRCRTLAWWRPRWLGWTRRNFWPRLKKPWLRQSFRRGRIPQWSWA